MGKVPSSPAYSSERLNWMWYSPNPILGQDLEGRLNFGNPAALKFFGYGEDKFTGMPTENLTPNDPLLRQNRIKIIREILESGVPREFQATQRVRGDGSEVIVPKWTGFSYMLNGQSSFGSILYPNYHL